VAGSATPTHLQRLAAGRSDFAGVKFNIYDFGTSPVPTRIMLGGEGIPNNPPQEVKGHPDQQESDALFFLHTARIDQRRNNDEVRTTRSSRWRATSSTTPMARA
jgi:hypothetical protein